MLSFEDKILIKNLWKCKRFYARGMVKEFSNKNWKWRTLRTPSAGSGRPWSSWTAGNTAEVIEFVQSQEDTPQQYLSAIQISRELRPLQTKVMPIIQFETKML